MAQLVTRKPGVIDRLRERARQLQQEVVALYFASLDPRTPRSARLLVAAIVAYALSPIDLIPDFIPVVGYLDDLILLPAAIVLAIRLIPDEVMESGRERARQLAARPNASHTRVIVVITTIWVVSGALLAFWLYGIFVGAT